MHLQGHLDLVMRAERHNKVKVRIFFDIGCSMDAHIKLCEELLSAAVPSGAALGIAVRK